MSLAPPTRVRVRLPVNLVPQAEPSRGGVHLTRTSPEEEDLTTPWLGEQAKVPPELSIVYSTGNLFGLSKIKA